MNTTTKKVIRRDQEIVFTNFTDKDFTGMWDKRLYPLKAGKSYYLPFYLAEHFAKHLAEREYWRTFNDKLQELKTQIGSQVDRRTLEHRVQNSNEVNKLSLQEMIDKCVTVLPETEDSINIVRPKEIKVREAVLRRDLRSQDLSEKYGLPTSSSAGGGALQMNKEALRQAEQEEKAESEEFEEETK